MLKKIFALDKDTFSAISYASVAGLHIVSGMLVGGVMGWFLDRWLGTFPWFSVIFFLAGIVAGFRNMWLEVKKIIRLQEAADEKKKADRNVQPPPEA